MRSREKELHNTAAPSQPQTYRRHQCVKCETQANVLEFTMNAAGATLLDSALQIRGNIHPLPPVKGVILRLFTHYNNIHEHD